MKQNRNGIENQLKQANKMPHGLTESVKPENAF
jgi:hypothetical protein